MARPKKKPSERPHRADRQGEKSLYSLEVTLISGPITEEFIEKNPDVARTIQIRGDQTLEQLHDSIYRAFDRDDEHLYEFQFGNQPMDPTGARYGIPDDRDMGMDMGMGFGGKVPLTEPADRTSIDSLGLTLGVTFFYWFDFGDDWWHRIKVKAIADESEPGTFPKLIDRVGNSPPQYPNMDDDEYGEDEDEDEDDDESEEIEEV